MGAEEQHDGFAVVVVIVEPGDRLESLPREALGEQGEEVHDLCRCCELIVGACEEAFDGFAAERGSNSAARRSAALVRARRSSSRRDSQVRSSVVVMVLLG